VFAAGAELSITAALVRTSRKRTYELRASVTSPAAKI
jgi:hypothetical protein